ncbi:MAG: proline--tRNA ligase [Spirochaetes bacterium]|nr:proline--tRNA ligase [Spirochaetota bacterium]
MLLSKIFGNRLKEAPKDAQIISHILLYRAGFIRQNASGIYSIMPLGFKVTNKIINIIREEMNKIDGQEVLLPSINPKEMWEKTGRYQSIGPELFRFKDRNEKDMVLAMTHEEAVSFLAKTELFSYKQIPFMIYQFQLKYRDEPRPRGGLIRVREFTMKDAYSFHIDKEELNKYYYEVHRAYENVFTRVGLKNFISVRSDVGMMGGKLAHEFMLLSENGEDTLIICDKCGYKANREIAQAFFPEEKEELKKEEEVYTPNKSTIEDVAKFLNIPLHKTGKALFYYDEDNKKIIFITIRGDLNLNETKLKNYLKTKNIRFATDEEIKSIGCVPGFSSIKNIDNSNNNIRVILDKSILSIKNFVVGANKKDYHILNFNLGDHIEKYEIADLYEVNENLNCPECKSKLSIKRGIEIGNIFQLGDKYTKSYDIKVLDKDGKAIIPEMCSYGIGIGRLMAAIAEESHDDYGLIWPITVSPFEIHFISLLKNNNEFVENIYKDLKKNGIDVLYDDRDESPGVKFSDADLIGTTFQLIISEKNLKNNIIELRYRKDKKSIFIELNKDYIKHIKWHLFEEYSKYCIK